MHGNEESCFCSAGFFPECAGCGNSRSFFRIDTERPGTRHTPYRRFEPGRRHRCGACRGSKRIQPISERTATGELLHLNPRRLVVLLATASGFREILKRDDLLPSQHDEEMPCMADPLDSEVLLPSIAATSSSGCKRFQTAGVIMSPTKSSRFDWRGAGYALFGYDSSDFSRSSGEQFELSINYLTGVREITEGLNVFHDSKPTVVWKRVRSAQKFFLDEISLSCENKDASQKDNWSLA